MDWLWSIGCCGFILGCKSEPPMPQSSATSPQASSATSASSQVRSGRNPVLASKVRLPVPPALQAPLPQVSPAVSAPLRTPLPSCGRGARPNEPSWTESVGRAQRLEGRMIGVRGRLIAYRAPKGVELPCARGACPPEQRDGLAIAADQNGQSSLAIRGFACFGTGQTPCQGMPIGREAVAVGQLQRAPMASPHWQLIGASLCVVTPCLDCGPGAWGRSSDP